ncbi:hypothetical protein M407DRAFT_18134 [Tulasnella calospora MUT 4182]|uniref:Methyltransferase domain-containing protein n=1 Tax=Tulasnella calospora MUT 4182 TaxID=1051891 RepID=A0A0C3LG77_9AGAM|nr:hypothetical protein M407DRAFT_18134 [Tulasnella calospora MUT 4182]
MDDYSERGSDSDSRAGSIFSNSSEDRNLILQEIFGRTINSTNEHYMLPGQCEAPYLTQDSGFISSLPVIWVVSADAPEHKRLDIQHEMLKQKLGGLYPREVASDVRRMMSQQASEDEPPPAAIDIGTGSGSWAIEMARQFPNAEITGMDIVPANSDHEIPSNCSFECDDANLGFGHYPECFDVVHARAVSSGISNYPEFLKDVWGILRPGGLFLAIEGNVGLFNKDFEPITTTDENHPDFSWMQVMMLSAREAQINRGSDVNAGINIVGWIDDMGEVWRNKGHFVFYIPVGPWEEPATSKERFIGILMRQNSLRFMGAVKPLLLSNGVPQETVDHWNVMAEDELRSGRTKTYTRWTCTWAFKAVTDEE